MRIRSWWTFCYDRTIIAFRRDDIRWLNTLLAVGLVSINLVAFGAAYWLATRDIMSEFTGEVRGQGARATDRAGWLKRSSLSKKIWLAPVEESSHVSLPLPLPRLNPSKPAGPESTSSEPVPARLADVPSASPSMAPLAEPERLDASPPADDAVVDVETGQTGPKAQSP